MFSIYIPRMQLHHTVASVAYYMSSIGIGIVYDVDFTTINKQKGFSENLDNTYKSAFVHFSELWISKEMECFETGQPLKIHITSTEYWLCLKNNNPIPRTLMNLPQVVENARYLEKVIEQQAEELKLLTARINILETKMKQKEEKEEKEKEE